MTTTKITQSVQIGALRTDAKDIIVFEHVYAIPVWRDGEVVYYSQYSKAEGYYLGKTTTLRYLLDASKTKV
jgi:hypothetical protein